MNGIETAKIITQKNTKVIFLTAQSDKTTFNKVQKTKALDIIIKPFNNKRLQESIKEGLTEIHNYSNLNIECTLYMNFKDADKQ